MTAIQLSEAVRYERDGDLAVLTISNPPLNYTAAVSNGVGDGITRAETEGHGRCCCAPRGGSSPPGSMCAARGVERTGNGQANGAAVATA